MEPISTAVGAGLVAYASKDLIAKLLGPSAEYIGGEIGGLVEKCNINLSDIFKKAARKAGDTLDDGSQVNPRVLKAVVSEGSFCDDDTIKEYYAGILASSRSEDINNDIGVSHLATLKSLSVYSIRLHYLFYREYFRLYEGDDTKIGWENELDQHELNIPTYVLQTAMNTDEDLMPILFHAALGLSRQGLVSEDWVSGEIADLKKYYGNQVQRGIVLTPSHSGIELFLWANGKQNISIEDFLTSPSIDPDINFPIPPGATKVDG